MSQGHCWWPVFGACNPTALCRQRTCFVITGTRMELMLAPQASLLVRTQCMHPQRAVQATLTSIWRDTAISLLTCTEMWLAGPRLLRISRIRPLLQVTAVGACCTHCSGQLLCNCNAAAA